MPLVDHYRKDFMDFIVGNRVVIIAHQDVDSVCTVKILTNLFKTEGISYILLSCDGISDLKAKYDEYAGQSDWFILVNCGGSVDLKKLLEPPRNKTFFIMDSRRPIDILNYYDVSGQIRLVSVPEPDETIPAANDIFIEDFEAEESDDEEESLDDLDEDLDEDGLTPRMRRRAERQRKAQEHRAAVTKRDELLYNYRKHMFYSRPSAIYALEIAWVMSRDDMESIWCTIVALTDALITGHLPRAKYTEYASTVNDHILRITNAEKLPRDCLKIRFERELFMFLYRNWSVYESAKMTPYLVNTLRTWSLEGNRRFHQLLAYLGLPLVEVKQKFMNMSMDLRRQLIDMFSSSTAVEKYKLPDLVFGSFIAEIGFRPKFNAVDVQLATLAVLEEPDESKSNEVRFLEATHVLNCRDHEAFKNGVEKAKSMLQLMYSQVQMLVETKQVQEMGPFVFFQLSETLSEFNYFKRTTSIPLLVHFLQHAGVRAGRRKWRQMSWVVMIPYSSEYFNAIGIPPGSYEQEQETKNVFPPAFRFVHSKMPEDVLLDQFDSWAMLVKNSKRQTFIDLLLAIAD